MPNESLGQGAPLKKQEELSPVLQQIQEIPLNYSEHEWKELAFKSDTAGTTKVLEDSILKLLKSLIQEPVNVISKIDLVFKHLSKESMKESSHKELFTNAIKELATKYNYQVESKNGNQ